MKFRRTSGREAEATHCVRRALSALTIWIKESTPPFRAAEEGNKEGKRHADAYNAHEVLAVVQSRIRCGDAEATVGIATPRREGLGPWLLEGDAELVPRWWDSGPGRGKMKPWHY